MKMVNLKLSKQDRKKYQMDVMPSISGGDDYPYGLSVSLEDHCLDKLGLDVNDFSVRDVLTMTARVKVQSLSANENRDGKKQGMFLQITDMSLEEGKFDKADKQNKKGPGEY